jgi:hypothetical protein
MVKDSHLDDFIEKLDFRNINPDKVLKSKKNEKNSNLYSFRDNDDNLCNLKFASFLPKITAFIFAYALTNPGVNALRTPVYAEMIKLYSGQECNFTDFKFEENHLRNVLENYKFTNNRMITRSLITWYAFTFESQQAPVSDKTRFDIEHIYAKERHYKENKLGDPARLESLGNKILLERKINIRASDYRFEDKKKYYSGYVDAKGKKHPGSMIKEYRELVQKENFFEKDIVDRDRKIKNKFIEYLYSEDLIK